MLMFAHGFSETVKKTDFQSHCHLHYELLYIKNGSGIFLLEDTACEFSGDTVFLIPPNLYHVLKIPPQRNYDRYLFHFSGDNFPAELLSDKYFVLQADDKLQSLFEKFESYNTEFSSRMPPYLMNALLVEILTVMRFSKEQAYVPKAQIPTLVQSAVSYVNKHLSERMDVTSVSEALYVSPAYLGHLFAKTMNISLMRYVRLKKMYRAREHLKHGLSVARTAELLGYDSYHTFLRNYNEVFDSLPSKVYNSPGVTKRR